eukprot:snap_masked-scaffold_5-processed-gene-20.77-mRNA-1 protein AED:1.00 eAED:1.00 QI:0/0/0/0/1/1/2/0/328
MQGKRGGSNRSLSSQVQRPLPPAPPTFMRDTPHNTSLSRSKRGGKKSYYQKEVGLTHEKPRASSGHLSNLNYSVASHRSLNSNPVSFSSKSRQDTSKLSRTSSHKKLVSARKLRSFKRVRANTGETGYDSATPNFTAEDQEPSRASAAFIPTFEDKKKSRRFEGKIRRKPTEEDIEFVGTGEVVPVKPPSVYIDVYAPPQPAFKEIQSLHPPVYADFTGSQKAIELPTMPPSFRDIRVKHKSPPMKLANPQLSQIPPDNFKSFSSQTGRSLLRNQSGLDTIAPPPSLGYDQPVQVSRRLKRRELNKSNRCVLMVLISAAAFFFFQGLL